MNIYMEVISLRAWSSSSLQFLSIQLVYEQEVEGRDARTWRMVKRWRVSKGGAGAIPTRQQGKGSA